MFIELNSAESYIARQCVLTIFSTPIIDDWELHTRIGFERSAVAKAYITWNSIGPLIVEAGNVEIVLICLNEVCSGFPSKVIKKYATFEFDRAEVHGLVRKVFDFAQRLRALGLIWSPPANGARTT